MPYGECSLPFRKGRFDSTQFDWWNLKSTQNSVPLWHFLIMILFVCSFWICSPWLLQFNVDACMMNNIFLGVLFLFIVDFSSLLLLLLLFVLRVFWGFLVGVSKYYILVNFVSRLRRFYIELIIMNCMRVSQIIVLDWLGICFYFFFVRFFLFKFIYHLLINKLYTKTKMNTTDTRLLLICVWTWKWLIHIEFVIIHFSNNIVFHIFI